MSVALKERLVRTGTTSRIDVDALIDEHLAAALAELDGAAPLLAGMARYHLGRVDQALAPVANGAVDRGKRVRPLVALLGCAAVGGTPAEAAPLAAAIELLHNFTLVHDDIQDRSPTRRHRPTVWSIWGEAQAINAGDALFAAAHVALFALSEERATPRLVLRLAAAFDRMTIEIVGGQVLDLSFEGDGEVSPADYLRMIDGKTAAIVRYAAWAGALVGGADEATANRFGEVGRAIGLGFQIRDDLLGIWAESVATGKAPADDIRRRKQSLPIVLLRQRATPTERGELDALYRQPEIGPAGVARVLTLLDRHEVRRAIELEIVAYHDRAREALLDAGLPTSQALEALLALVESLSVRQG